MRTFFQRLVAATVLAAVIPFAALAGPFPEASGPVVLTIDGNLAPDAPEGGFVLDMAGLQSLPATTFTTKTIWTDGDTTFTGVSLKQLLGMAGATGVKIWAEALNGYLVEISMSDLEEDYPIIAYHIDGKEFSRRDKGPLWIVYPYDKDEKYKSEIIYGNSVWQLQKLKIE